MKSEHQLNVEAFMLRAKQEVPLVPTELDEATRLLRAKLILEEAQETIIALGCRIALKEGGDYFALEAAIDECQPFIMMDVIDGCCDLAVVATGTLSAMGVPDLPFIRAIDSNNLAKFAPGHSWREDGKLQKPPGHKPPDLRRILESLTA